MITTLKQLLPEIEAWPAEDQEALVEAARRIEAGRAGVHVMSPDESAAVDEGLAELERGEFAPEEEIASLWARYAAR
jgi:predicted transcriptional regulator